MDAFPVNLDALPVLGPVAWYVFVMAGTPGPNNAMLAASGMNFGLMRTLPHIAGICVGITLLMLATGLGLGVIFATVPEAQTALAIVGSIYLVYLAWRIANAGAPSAAEGAKPIGFAEAFGFQFLHPKGWVMALNAALLMPDFESVAVKAVVLGILALSVGCTPMPSGPCSAWPSRAFSRTPAGGASSTGRSPPFCWQWSRLCFPTAEPFPISSGSVSGFW